MGHFPLLSVCLWSFPTYYRVRQRRPSGHDHDAFPAPVERTERNTNGSAPSIIPTVCMAQSTSRLHCFSMAAAFACDTLHRVCTIIPTVGKAQSTSRLHYFSMAAAFACNTFTPRYCGGGVHCVMIEVDDTVVADCRLPAPGCRQCLCLAVDITRTVACLPPCD